MPRKLHIVEFVTIIAVLFASAAFAIDGMLPAFPQMAAELSPSEPNSIQLAISVFIIGLGAGTFVAGPLADTYGRKAVVLGGALLFVVGCLVAHKAQSLEALLAGRLLQGLGAAGPRIGPMAMMRDLYSGRRMAQLTSIIMTVFMLFPAVAPSIGAAVIYVWDWRALFLGFALFTMTGALWLTIRQSETLAPEDRRSLRLGEMAAAAKEVLSNRMVMIFTLALSFGFAELLSIISSIQPVYDQVFGRADSFPLWFALGALVASGGTVLNAVLVMKLGMRRLVLLAFSIQVVLAAISITIFAGEILSEPYAFALWFLWSSSNFFMAGLLFGNLNALALQPLGHIAGMASSLITGISTVLAGLLAIPISIAFDGTPLPLMVGNMIFAGLAAWLVWTTRKVPLDEFA